MTLAVRAGSRAETLEAPICEIVRAIDPQQPVTNVRPYDAVVAESVATRRFAAALLGIFAVTALLLSVVGVYGALESSLGSEARKSRCGSRWARARRRFGAWCYCRGSNP